MTCPSERFCSDCAFPYECAEQDGCVRRDNGEIRSVDDVSPVPGHLEPGELRDVLREQDQRASLPTEPTIDVIGLSSLTRIFGIDPGHPEGDQTGWHQINLSLSSVEIGDGPRIDFAREWRRQWALSKLAEIGRLYEGALVGVARKVGEAMAAAMVPSIRRWCEDVEQAGRRGLFRGGPVGPHVHVERSRQCGRRGDVIIPQRPGYRRRS